MGRRFHARGWALGTSGNFSAVVSRRPFRLAITASGHDKRTLRPAHIVTVDAAGSASAEAGGRRPRRCCTSTIARATGRRRRHAHAFGLEHDAVRLARRCRRPSHRGLRDAEGARRRDVARAPRVDSDSRKRSGHAASGRASWKRRSPASPRRMPCSCGGTGCTPGERRSRRPSVTSRFWSSCSRHSRGARATMRSDQREAHHGARKDSSRGAHD